jgi:hypothetical protein
VQGLLLSSLHPVTFGPVIYTVFYMYSSVNTSSVFGEKRYHYFIRATLILGARRSVIRWGSTLQAGRLRVQLPMRSLDFSVYVILPAALSPKGSFQPHYHPRGPSSRTITQGVLPATLSPKGSTQPLTEINIRPAGAWGWHPYRHLWADFIYCTVDSASNRNEYQESSWG